LQGLCDASGENKKKFGSFASSLLESVADVANDWICEGIVWLFSNCFVVILDSKKDLEVLAMERTERGIVL
jgi:hypothetical protein